MKDHLAKLDNYLKYRHAEEANIQAAKINPWNETLQKGFNLTDKPGSGILTSDARAELAKLESGPDGAALKEAGRLYNKMIAGLQQYAVERGLEDQDTINAWQNVFPNYAPFNRDLDLVSTFYRFPGRFRARWCHAKIHGVARPPSNQFSPARASWGSVS